MITDRPEFFRIRRFTHLEDTPNTFLGAGLKFLQINAVETKLAPVNLPSGITRIASGFFQRFSIGIENITIGFNPVAILFFTNASPSVSHSTISQGFARGVSSSEQHVIQLSTTSISQHASNNRVIWVIAAGPSEIIGVVTTFGQTTSITFSHSGAGPFFTTSNMWIAFG